MKIRPVGAELFHEDGQTDIHDEANSSFSQFFSSCSMKMDRQTYTMKLIVVFRNFSKAPKNEK